MNILSIGINALFLREDAYAQMRDLKKALVIGLILIIVLALVVAIFALIGQVIAYNVGPDLGAIQKAVWQGMITSSWWREMPREAQVQTQQYYEMGWKTFPAMFGAPNPLAAFFGLFSRPLVYLLDWLIFGIIGFVLAKFIFKGEGRLPAFLGVLALAATPQIFYFVLLIPHAQVDGLLINLWSLCCAYLAIKVSFNLSVAKAFWATLVTWLLALIPFFLVSGFFGAIVSGVQAALSGLGK
jgi:hypothetical protein